MKYKIMLILLCTLCMVSCQIAPINAAVDKDYDMTAKLNNADTIFSFISAAFWKTHVDFKSIAIQMNVNYKVKNDDNWKHMTGYCLLTPITPTAPILLYHSNIRSNPIPYWDLYVIKPSMILDSSHQSIRVDVGTDDAKTVFEYLNKKYPDKVEHYSGKVSIVS